MFSAFHSNTTSNAVQLVEHQVRSILNGSLIELSGEKRLSNVSHVVARSNQRCAVVSSIHINHVGNITRSCCVATQDHSEHALSNTVNASSK